MMDDRFGGPPRMVNTPGGLMYPGGMQQVSNHPSGLIPFHPENLDQSINPKLYVGGLPPNLVRDDLKRYFEFFGPVTECIIMSEKDSGTSRGFGFVTFENADHATLALSRVHQYYGKILECKKAKPKEIFGDYDGEEQNLITRKIFVGGITNETTDEELRNVFGRFGRVTELSIMPDKQSDTGRRFAFVTFEHPMAVEKIMQNYFSVRVGGRWVECKRVLSKDSGSGNATKDEKASKKDKENRNLQVEVFPAYGSFHYKDYGIGDAFVRQGDRHYAHSPPVFPTPLTPPYIRMSNYRHEYLRKRVRVISPELVSQIQEGDHAQAPRVKGYFDVVKDTPQGPRKLLTLKELARQKELEPVPRVSDPNNFSDRPAHREHHRDHPRRRHPKAQPNPNLH